MSIVIAKPYSRRENCQLSIVNCPLSRICRSSSAGLLPKGRKNPAAVKVKSCHLVAILSESVIYEEEGYKAIPIKEAKETMHASLVYVKGMYQRNAVKEFFKRMQIR